jgi:hypothetical protein
VHGGAPIVQTVTAACPGGLQRESYYLAQLLQLGHAFVGQVMHRWTENNREVGSSITAEPALRCEVPASMWKPAR